jgi:hypothetical protein
LTGSVILIEVKDLKLSGVLLKCATLRQSDKETMEAKKTNESNVNPSWSLYFSFAACPAWIRACPIGETSSAQACCVNRDATQHALVGGQGQKNF